MKKFFTKFIEGSSILPPDMISTAFILNFPGALNAEWYNRKEGGFEVIFYNDDIEHIAIFDSQGVLNEYKKSLPETYMPEKIKSELESKGEIMNVVMINHGNRITYEVIIRDRQFIRSLLLLNEWGEIQSERKL